MRNIGFCDLGFAKLDINRKARRGFAEAIYCPGKSREQLVKITRQMLKNRHELLLTRLDNQHFTFLKAIFPRLEYNSHAKLAYFKPNKKNISGNIVVVISAGTGDMPIAEEAAVTLEVMGSCVNRLYDVGVAGVHRLLHNLKILKKAKVIVVVAGMEGALASLVSGLVSCPIIAVPTSCGYGASFQGLAALLSMLNSCSPGVTVVNIDNGFGAGYFAHLVNK
ncbi:MAG: nickel pincer cofactor biosynthesis protein LarB [Candidatus Omnitrophica bacterium]|nr:nickel pincer cofactor biosynthesis protein LarB [Candidatus Omnitrophota bacterium]